MVQGYGADLHWKGFQEGPAVFSGNQTVKLQPFQILPNRGFRNGKGCVKVMNPRRALFLNPLQNPPFARFRQKPDHRSVAVILRSFGHQNLFAGCAIAGKSSGQL